MHPAHSIILFTVLSGLGFGNLFFLGTFATPETALLVFLQFGIAFALSTVGLIASTFHLGHPERALKAFTQWRSSWLSREGWLACATLIVMGLFALSLLLFSPIGALGWLGAVGCLATVYATSMIYAQLKTVPRWNHWSTSALFVTLSLAGGAVLSGLIWAAIILMLAAAALQLYAWQRGDGALAQSGTNLATATGLGSIGSVSSFEPPHTGGNYLTKEMVFVVARKHAVKLRVIGLVLAIALPALLLLLPFSHALALAAVLSHVAGVFVIRWLFFAEAEHVVGLYYGQR